MQVIVHSAKQEKQVCSYEEFIKCFSDAEREEKLLIKDRFACTPRLLVLRIIPIPKARNVE